MLQLLLLPAALAAPPAIPHQTYTLDNGLEVILAEDHSTPIVAVNVWYHVGSGDEKEGLTGFAHLFEHLMFQGSASNPDEYFTPLQRVGAVINGTTNAERTNYFEVVPRSELPLALFMESDRMGWLLGELTQEKLDNQREVVKNERRQRVENPPYGSAWNDLLAMVWPPGHPYHHSTIGSHEDLENAKLEEVRAFFEKWYVPNNATLAVVGDFKPDTAKELIATYFANIPRGDTPQRAAATTSKDVSKRATTRVEVQYQDVPQQKLWMAWPTPGRYTEDEALLEIFGELLGGGPAARLQSRLIDELGMATEVRAFNYGRELGGTFMVLATAAPDHDTDAIAAEVSKVVAELLGDQPPTEEHLEAVVAEVERYAFQALNKVQGKADLLNSYNQFTGNPGYLATDLARYSGHTPTGIVDRARPTFAGGHVELHIRPTGDAP
jgi:zinc protease